ncbi:MAG: hypothetical protein E6Q97_07415 [Desulfurellales bacterium]|nr:MAG: hypothetical protein E6Q97_07415 [Desulfurellales bacterium]
MNIFLPDTNEVHKGVCGAIVSWELARAVDYRSFSAGLAALDIKGVNIPPPATTNSALSRVLDAEYADRNCLVKPVRLQGATGQVNGFAVMPKSRSDGRLAFVANFYVYVEEVRDIVVDDKGKEREGDLLEAIVQVEPPNEEVRERLQTLFDVAILGLGSTEQSLWLTALVKGTLHGVSMPGGHGHFFVGRNELPIWRSVKSVCTQHGIRMYETPAMKSAEAVEAVIEGLRQTIAAEHAALSADLSEYATRLAEGKKVQNRVLDNRQKRVQEMVERLEHYESLFEMRLNDLRASVDQLRIGYGMSELAQIT